MWGGGGAQVGEEQTGNASGAEKVRVGYAFT